MLIDRLRQSDWFEPTLIVAIAAASLVTVRAAARAAGRAVSRRHSPQAGLVAERVAFTLSAAFISVVTLHRLGVELGVLLGTAGVATIALGFAAQTSASNVISGMFLLGEQPFRVGDAICVGTTVGEVVRIDLLSVKLRTFDNLLIRIPNETLLRSEIANLSHFPIRRLDVRLGVPYGEDIGPLRQALFSMAADNPLCLDEPTPMVIVDAFEESSVKVQFSVWSARDNYLEMKNSVLDAIQRSIYGGGFAAPLPVRVIISRDA